MPKADRGQHRVSADYADLMTLKNNSGGIQSQGSDATMGSSEGLFLGKLSHGLKTLSKSIPLS